MRYRRLRGYLDALGVLICETVLMVFFTKSGQFLGSVPFAHLATWLQSVSPERALTALVRLLGMGVSAWLLGSTLLYAVAAMSGSRRLLKGSRAITLPVLRRALDALAAASLAASSIGTAASIATASSAPRPAPIVQPLTRARLAASAAAGPTVAKAAPQRVSAAATGRHFPHPGEVAHALPGGASLVRELAGRPSEEDPLAGLPKGTKVVVVRPGDCLSVLAERHLGDWRLDSEIEALNWGRRQPDGRALVDDHWIYPGWVLVMPENAVGTTIVREAGARPVTTTRLAKAAAPIAPAAHRPTPTTAVTRASAVAPTTAVAPTAPARPAIVAPHWAAPPPASRLAVPPPPPARRPVPAGAPTPEDTPIGPRPSGPGSSTVHTGSVEPARQDDRTTADRTTTVVGISSVGVGALVAAGAIWRLERSRREQLHARPKDGIVPRNKPPVEAAECRARAIAASEVMRWVDLASRYLSSLVEQASLQTGARVPSLVLMKAGRGGIEALMSPAPEGRMGWFCPTADEMALALDADIGLDDLEALARDRWPAWPAMVSLGETGEGALVLNLEHAGSLSVEGADLAVEGVLASVALQLASQPWCDEMLAGLYVMGDRPAGAHYLGPPRGLQWTEDDRALDLAEKLGRIAGAHQELAGEVSLSTVRAVACEALPNVAVAFGGAPAAAVRCLAEAAVPERSGVALVGAGPFEGARWRLVLGDGGAATLQGPIADRPVSVELTVNCDPQEVALLSEALGASGDRDGVPGPGGSGTGSPLVEVARVIEATPPREALADIRQDVAGQRGPGALRPVPERGDVEICILGPVDVVGGELDLLEPSRRMAALGLLAYMAAHERPVNADELGSSLWPLDATKDNLGGPQRKTVMNVISRARSVLGYGVGGKERLVYSPLGYRLSSDVTSDWGRFERYVARSRGLARREAMACLRSALELVRGQPFGGAMSSQFFEWVASEHLDMTVSAKAVDVAQDLGELALEDGDLGTVAWAVEKGLQLEPTREEMFRLWMHALGRSGRPAKVDDVYRRLKLVLRQRIHPLQEPQEASRRVWRSYTSAEMAGRQG